MPTSEFLRKLRLINSNFCAPNDSIFPYIVQNAKVVGLYLGDPSFDIGRTTKDKHAKFICSMPADFIPEFTQIGPKGVIVARGWRSVLAKIMSERLAPVAALEAVFASSMSRDGRDAACPRCRKEGQITKGEGASGLCSLHEYTRTTMAEAERSKREFDCA